MIIELHFAHTLQLDIDWNDLDYSKLQAVAQIIATLAALSMSHSLFAAINQPPGILARMLLQPGTVASSGKGDTTARAARLGAAPAATAGRQKGAAPIKKSK